MKFKLVTAQVTAYFAVWLDCLRFMEDQPADSGPWELYDDEENKLLIKGGQNK